MPRAPLRPCLLPFLAAVLALPAGCARDADMPLQPVYRLQALLEHPLPRDAAERCEIGDEYRPAIGCLPVLAMVRRTVPVPPSRELSIDAVLAPALRGVPLVAEPRVRVARGDAWLRTPTLLLPRQDERRVWVPVPLPAEVEGREVDVQVFGRPVPPNEQRHVTRPLRIGRGAHLAVGLGLDPLGTKVGASSVQFRLTVEAEDGARELLRTTLSPLDAPAWSDHRLDLGPWAGRTVRIRMETSVLVRPGADPAAAFGFPLWGSPQIVEPRRRDGRRNVILVSLDTLRGDYVGGSLNGVPLMPELTRIAERGTLFENATATYPSTTASHMTMLTGLYPASHQVVFAAGSLLPDIVTLPEILAQNGYATFAVTEDAMLAAQAGFLRGFDRYREFKGPTMWDTAGQIEDTFATGLRWLESHRNERFFLFLHTYEVHAPYEPPAGFDVFHTWEKDGVEVPVDDRTPRPIKLRNRYAGEVRYADSVVAQLVGRLEALGVLDDTILVFTSDHGDEFGEHGMTGHAKSAYDEVLHVPLILVAPGLVPAGERIATPVSLVDLAPTLLSLVKIAAPPATHGESLVPLLHGAPFPKNRVLYAESPSWGKRERRIAARTARFKWVATSDGGTPITIYDLSVDPGEERPIDDVRLATIGEQMIGYYREVDAVGASRLAAQGDPLEAPKPELDDRTVESLKALGYVD
jgi:arylsulfatase A-like enzyme